MVFEIDYIIAGVRKQSQRGGQTLKKKVKSWGLIFILMYFLFPVGIWMMVKKVTSERSRYLQNGKVLKYFAYVLLVMVPLSVIMEINGELQQINGAGVVGTAVILALIFGISGMFTLKKGNYYMNRGKKYIDCISALTPQRSVSLDQVAAELKLPYHEVVSDFQEMIAMGVAGNVMLDMNVRQLVSQVISKPLREVECPYCGAKAKLPVGTSGKCEYCDSLLG